MRVTELSIKNYRSFDPEGQVINFPTMHCALVGKNNAGKSNIFNALDIVLGYKNPPYIKFSEEDYFDAQYPIEIKVAIGDFQEEDKSYLFSIPHLTKPQQGALNKKVADGSGSIYFLLRKSCADFSSGLDEEESEDVKDVFEINIWGFIRHKQKEEARKAIIRMLMVNAIRNHKDELSASTWTQYGRLMKEVLENAPQYSEIKEDLSKLNSKIQEVFETQKKKVLENARITSYVDDIMFQLTKENHPSELLRNLEIFVREGTKLFNIDYVGTGTQSAIVIGILELALKSKGSNSKLFCIEEPEAFIHPHGIRYLGSLIKDMSAEQNTQVLIATHSLSLTANFEPKEIIRVDKESGKTVIRQDPEFDTVHFRRFVHQDNVEMFFSDRVILVEGSTEKHLFSKLDKYTKIAPSEIESENCNFDRINVGVIRMDSVDSIINYIKILKAFNVQYCALLDKDFITDPSKKQKVKDLCSELSLQYKDDENQLISDLKTKNILVNTKGETEDLFPDQDIVDISGKDINRIQKAKQKYPNKTSKAFKEIFDSGKPEYAICIADYYIQNSKPHPLEEIIRKLYGNDIQGIDFN